MKLDISYKEGCAEVSVDGKPVPGLLSFTLDCRGYMEPCIFTPVIDLSWGSEIRLNSVGTRKVRKEGNNMFEKRKVKKLLLERLEVLNEKVKACDADVYQPESVCDYLSEMCEIAKIMLGR